MAVWTDILQRSLKSLQVSSSRPIDRDARFIICLKRCYFFWDVCLLPVVLDGPSIDHSVLGARKLHEVRGTRRTCQRIPAPQGSSLRFLRHTETDIDHCRKPTRAVFSTICWAMATMCLFFLYSIIFKPSLIPKTHAFVWPFILIYIYILFIILHPDTDGDIGAAHSIPKKSTADLPFQSLFSLTDPQKPLRKDPKRGPERTRALSASPPIERGEKKSSASERTRLHSLGKAQGMVKRFYLVSQSYRTGVMRRTTGGK